MSPRLLRIDARLDAMLFPADSVRFEACPTFRAGADVEFCHCGWLEADHRSGSGAAAAVRTRRLPRRRPARVAIPRAS